MKTKKYILGLFVFVCMGTLTGCIDDDPAIDFDTKNNIPWIVSTITSVSPLTGSEGDKITLTGEHLDLVMESGVIIGPQSCKIISQSASQIVAELPKFTASDLVNIQVKNLHNRTFTYKEKFATVK